MPFWNQETEAEKRRREMQEFSLRCLERGEIPPHARQRCILQTKAGNNFFTSSLTSNEHFLTREAGYEPIGQVMGSSFYKIGWWGNMNGYSRNTGELVALTHAQQTARILAVSRMKQEASLLGAHGVIGVRMESKGYEWSSGTLEFTAIGTAVRIPGREPTQNPFSSMLSGQEFWQLEQAGYWPVDVVLGTCSYYVHSDWATNQVRQGGIFAMGSWNNQELDQYTWGMQSARELAVNRLTRELFEIGADGAVGMTMDYRPEEIEYEVNKTIYRDLLIHFLTMGTAIKYDPQSKKDKCKPPLMIINLASGRKKQLAFAGTDELEQLINKGQEK